MTSTPIKLLLLFVFAWAAGLLAYIGSLGLFWQQSISRGDFVAVVMSSAVGFLVAFLVVYLPVLFGLRLLLGGVRPAWPFPLAAVLLGIAPTSFVLFYWGGDLRSFLTPEASLFYAMFTIVGLLVGLGYVRIHRQLA